MLCVDTETGGLDPLKNALCSVAVRNVETGDEASWLVRPAAGLDLEPEAMAVNGFSRSLLEQDGVCERTMLLELNGWVEAQGVQDWCGANPQFDKGFLQAAANREGLRLALDRPPIDIQALAWMADYVGLIRLERGKDGKAKRSLDAILQALGIVEGRSSAVHTAREDCELTAIAFQEIMKKMLNR